MLNSLILTDAGLDVVVSFVAGANLSYWTLVLKLM